MKKMLQKVRAKIAEKQFCKYAITGKNLSWSEKARCINSGERENVRVGDHGFIGCQIYALFGGKVSIGDHCYIGMGTSIQAKERVEIGDNVIISNNVLIVDNNNHSTDPAARLEMSACQDYMTDELWSWKYAESKSIKICDNVWIGRDAAIMKGVTVGAGSIVALGAIVTKDVPAYTIAAGNPAKVVKELPKPEA